MASSFEQVDAIVSSVAASSATGGAAATSPLSPLCSAAAIIKPILAAVESIPFLPKNWKSVIEQFRKLLDDLCPVGGAMPAAPAKLDFESIDKAVKDAMAMHLAGCSCATPSPLGGAGPGIPAQFCSIYKAVKPILQLVSVFLPGAWQAGIAAFIAVADTVCK